MIKGVHYVAVRKPSRSTVWYVYAWRGGPQIKRVEGRNKPRLTRDDVDLLKAALDSQTSVDPTILRSLIREWRSQDPERPSSPEWEALAASTKKTWGSALDRIDEKWGDVPLAVWNDPRMVAKVVAWRDSRASTARAADIGVSTLRALLEFGRLRGRVSINVANGIPALYKNGQRSEIIWTEEDMLRFSASAEELGRPHIVDGLRLAALTGLRRADLVSLEWDHVGETAIKKRALKSSRKKRQYITVPLVPELKDLLAELRTRTRQQGVKTVLVNSFGESWSADGFGGSFNRVRDHAKIVHSDLDTGEERAKHLHDVRGTFCTKLLTEHGLTDDEAAGVMGWSVAKVSSIRRVYVDDSALIHSLASRMASRG
ncbi:tyrosine-type recombinase/integrase [Aurantiacibacter hainanensis]|uniref:tyrosine-type recombinase/integrase n=1 Tax=Aurantiacibacter hainanensis TaxID=3076114 RepID=UPI0030C67330